MGDDAPLLRYLVERDATADATIAHFAGEIDLSTSEDFAEGVRGALDSPCRLVVVDLAGVSFMGSIGLRVLTEAHQETERANRSLRVVGTGTPYRTIEISGLHQVLAVYTALADALTAR